MRLDGVIMRACRLCANAENNKPFIAREMMFGSREKFEYFECAGCGAVQIAELPPDLSRYYPEGYPSFRPRRRARNALLLWLKRRCTEHALGNPNGVGRVLRRWFEPRLITGWARAAGARLDDAILDAGSGTGRLLFKMRDAGFSNLTGADPFIERDIPCGPGLQILKRELRELTGPYDFIMLHHSIEHMPDPLEALKEVHRLLRPGRFCLVRTPLAGTPAWRTYGADWVHLDPPRHVIVHTERSLGLLAERAGLERAKTVFDSGGFQFWGSELYRRNIPLNEARPRGRLRKGLFSRKELAAFEAEAQRLNEQGRGDQVCLYLRKPEEGCASGTGPVP